MDRNSLCEMLIDNSESAMYVFDIESYEILFANKKLLRDFGCDDFSALSGKKCYKILLDRDTPCNMCVNAKLSDNKFCHWEAFNERINQHFTTKAKLLELDGRKVGFVTVDNTTKEYNERKIIEHNYKTERTLFECVKTLDGDDIQQTFDRLFEIVTHYFNGDRAYMFEINEQNHTISNTYKYAREGVTKEIENLQNVPIDVVKVWLEAFKERGSFLISSVDEVEDKNSLEYKLLIAQNITSLIASPIIVDKKIVGFFGVDNPRSDLDDAIEFLKSITYFINNYLEKRNTLSTLSKMSFEDRLTGVFNRNKYNERVDRLETAKPNTLGVLFIDLNGLKKVNDTYGHKQGDLLLKNTAHKAKEIFGDDVYRIGGDEFIIICENITKDDFIEKQMELVYSYAQKDIYASMGLSWEQAEDVNVKVQLLTADKKMYIEKAEYYKNSMLYGTSFDING